MTRPSADVRVSLARLTSRAQPAGNALQDEICVSLASSRVQMNPIGIQTGRQDAGVPVDHVGVRPTTGHRRSRWLTLSSYAYRSIFGEFGGHPVHRPIRPLARMMRSSALYPNGPFVPSATTTRGGSLPAAAFFDPRGARAHRAILTCVHLDIGLGRHDLAPSNTGSPMAYTGPVSADPVFGLANDRTASETVDPPSADPDPRDHDRERCHYPEDSGRSGAEGILIVVWHSRGSAQHDLVAVDHDRHRGQTC